MTKGKDRLIGDLLFRTKDGNKAIVWVHRGPHTFTLRRAMQDGTTEERTKGDPYDGNLSNYVSEAMLVWHDLEPEGVELNPKF
jgi:hypothetical protein